MIDEATIYWITRFDSLHSLATVATAFSGIIALFAAFFWATGGPSDSEAARQVGRRLLCCLTPLFVVATAAAVLVPTTKEAIAIKVIPRIVANDNVQQVGEEFLGLAKEWMQELRPKKKESEGR